MDFSNDSGCKCKLQYAEKQGSQSLDINTDFKYGLVDKFRRTLIAILHHIVSSVPVIVI